MLTQRLCPRFVLYVAPSDAGDFPTAAFHLVLQMLEKEIMHNYYLFAGVLHTASFYKLGTRETFAQDVEV